MDNKNFLISIKGMQTYIDDTDPSDVELITEGKFFEEDGTYFIEYEESEVTGMLGTNTRIEVGPEYVALIRDGEVNSHMIFMKDKMTTSYYETPFGTMTIGVMSDKITSKLSKHGGIIDVGYTIDINNERTGRNNFHITIQEAQNG